MRLIDIDYENYIYSQADFNSQISLRPVSLFCALSLAIGEQGHSVFISVPGGALFTRDQISTNQEECLGIKCIIESFKYHSMDHKFLLNVDNPSLSLADRR